MGEVTVKKTGIQGGIVYSHTRLFVGDMSANAVFFSGGDIELTASVSVTGAVTPKATSFSAPTRTKNISVTYTHSAIESIMANANNAPMFSTFAGEPELDENVFLDESITAQGRQS